MLPSRTLCEIARAIWRLPERRLQYVPNGVDCARFGRPGSPELARRLGVAEDRPVIGTVATLRREKNLGRLIDAFAPVRARRPVQLVIVGDGVERPGLEAKATAMGLAGDVLFTGPCPEPETLLSRFTVFALSSDTEQMPLSVLEAMAARRAVVATDVGDVRHMLANENQPFVVPRNPAPHGREARNVA